MTEASAFLDAILAAPDDEAQRLVFADWLEELGDPRGEFIRVQCQLANLDRYARGRTRLVSREKALLRQYGEQWALPASEVAWKPRFRKGFVEHIEGTIEQFLEQGDELFAAQPISSIRLRPFDGTDEQLERLIQSEWFGRVREFSAAPAAYLVNNRRGRGFDDDAVGMLLANKHVSLRSLELTGPGLAPQTLTRVAACPRLSTLRELRLSGLERTSQPVGLLAGSPYLRGLTSLSLTRVDLRREGAEALLRGEFPNLQSLALDLCHIGSYGAAALSRSPFFHRLTTLSLRGDLIGVRGVKDLLKAAHPNLRQLNLSSNRAGESDDAGVRAIAESPESTTLRELSLRRNRVSDTGAALLAASPHLQNLVALDLRANGLTIAGVRALRKSEHLQKSCRLDLRNNFGITVRDRERLRAEFGPRFARL